MTKIYLCTGCGRMANSRNPITLEPRCGNARCDATPAMRRTYEQLKARLTSLDAAYEAEWEEERLELEQRRRHPSPWVRLHAEREVSKAAAERDEIAFLEEREARRVHALLDRIDEELVKVLYRLNRLECGPNISHEA